MTGSGFREGVDRSCGRSPVLPALTSVIPPGPASTSVPYPYGMSKPQRKKIAERLLRMRLGLDEDWLTPDDEDKAHLPAALPRFITHECSEREIEELETDLDRLAAAGCRRGVLIFCLRQLSPGAKEIQAGREWVSKDEPEMPAKRFRELATKEDLDL
jgi:hypothetical protein